MKTLFAISVLFFAFITLTGCKSEVKTDETSILKKIDAAKAKEMIDQEEDIIILDVRTKEEYDTGHIKNAVLIPDYELEDEAEQVLTDKETTLLVYCRSGRRSKEAVKVLHELGYTKVYDMGGILDWPYEVIVE